MDAVMTAVKDGADAMPEGMTPGGKADDSALPERRCIVTREALEKDQLIRFVLGPDNAIVPDLLENLPGRGYWVTASRKVLAEAVKKNAFAKAMQAPVKPAADPVSKRLMSLCAPARRFC
jgi:predicted RNA-binding protein YlxR (DUF448 family)